MSEGRYTSREPDYEKFEQYVLEAEEKYGMLLHCHVLMSNHYHLIIGTPEANLSKVWFIHEAYQYQEETEYPSISGQI